ncbi:MAG TPA: hypothetical protein VFD43_10475, partial [Planctomycetota bacterium]|nr:hypothetical protein [Planctomycetota bacterium]
RALREPLRPAPEAAETSPGEQELDALIVALARQPAALQPDPETFYDDAEGRAFAAARARGALDGQVEPHSVTAPRAVAAEYSAGAVVVRWEPGTANDALSAALAGQSDGLRLAFRVYRSQDLAPPELRQTLPYGTTTWRDRDLPLAQAQLDYEVCTVLLRDGPTGEVLVGADRGEKVTVIGPEHFTLKLVGGSPEQAVFDVSIELPASAGVVSASARPGEPLLASGQPTGLVLESLTLGSVDVLTTQRRLLLTTDGSLVLDPTTLEPRTTETQVIVPGTRLTATLLDRQGGRRVLDVNLP